MESTFEKMAGTLNQTGKTIKTGIEFYRTLEAKNMRLGLSQSFQTVVCLHLAAERYGNHIELTTALKYSGAKSKPQYLDKYNNVKSILELNDCLTIQEICVKMSNPSLVKETQEALSIFEKFMLEKWGEARTKSINLSKDLYLCSAFYAAAKQSKVKVDSTKLAELAKSSKREMTEKGDEILGLLPAKKSFSAKSASDSFLYAVQEESDQDSTKRKLEEVTNTEEDFETWKRRILEKAVSAGFTKYKQYLTPTSC